MRANISSSILASVTPRNEYVLIKRDPAEKKRGSIILPDQSQTKKQLGTIVAVGPGKMEFGSRTEIGLEVGQRIIFQAYAGTEFLTDDNSEDEFVILKESDVLAVVA